MSEVIIKFVFGEFLFIIFILEIWAYHTKVGINRTICMSFKFNFRII